MQVRDANHSFGITAGILLKCFEKTKSHQLRTAFDDIDLFKARQTDNSHPMVIGVNGALPEYMQGLERNNLRLLIIWKLICFSASTSQLAYVLEFPNQLRSTLGTYHDFNQINNLENDFTSIKTGDIYICRGAMSKRGMHKWLKQIYNAVHRLFLVHNSSDLDLSVENG